MDFNVKGLDAQRNEKTFKLSDYKGKKVILFYYVKDDSPGCNKEACQFSDLSYKIGNEVVILGMNTDDLETHKEFMEKYEIKVPLLSDENKKFAYANEVWGDRILYGRFQKGIKRTTFVIDEKGNVLKRWDNVKVNGHVKEVENYLKSL